MAAGLRAIDEELGGAVHQVGAAWEGPASKAFAHHWLQLHGAVADGAGTFDEVAAHLDQIASQIEETNEQVHQLYLAMGITAAVGVATSVVTMGFGSAGAAAAAAAQAGQAATIVARLGTFLTISARAMSGFRTALVAFSQRWAIAAAGDALATAAHKAVFNPNHNPLDNWSIADVTKIAVGATSSAGLAGMASRSLHVAPVAARHPLRTGFAVGFGGGGGASVVNDLWVDRHRLSPATVGRAALSGVFGGTSAMAAGAVLLPSHAQPSAPASAGASRLVAVRRRRLWVPNGASGQALVGIPIDGGIEGFLSAPFTTPAAQRPVAPPLPAVPPLYP